MVAKISKKKKKERERERILWVKMLHKLSIKITITPLKGSTKFFLVIQQTLVDLSCQIFWAGHKKLCNCSPTDVVQGWRPMAPPCLMSFMNGPHSENIFTQTKSLSGKDVQKRDYNPQKIECKHNWKILTFLLAPDSKSKGMQIYCFLSISKEHWSKHKYVSVFLDRYLWSLI